MQTENKYYLSKMRQYRGNNNSVEVIGDPTGLVHLLKNSKFTSRDELTRAVMACYSGEAYGDCNWPKSIGGWTTSEEPTIYGNFRVQYEYLAQLSLDPGVITHLPEFMEFLKTHDQNTKDYLAIREGFKQHLDNKEVWRGMVLNDKEVEKIKNEGIQSNFLRLPEEYLSIENFESNILSTYFNELVERHFHGENFMSSLVSLSSNKDVAMVVGKYFGKGKSESKELYLFKINVPEIDLIFYNDHAIKTPEKIQSFTDGLEKQLRISVNGNEKTYPWDKDVESYILYKIDPDEIIEISKPEIKQFSWNGKTF